jgi:hypothetical protein
VGGAKCASRANINAPTIDTSWQRYSQGVRKHAEGCILNSRPPVGLVRPRGEPLLQSSIIEGLVSR